MLIIVIVSRSARPCTPRATRSRAASGCRRSLRVTFSYFRLGNFTMNIIITIDISSISSSSSSSSSSSGIEQENGIPRLPSPVKFPDVSGDFRRSLQEQDKFPVGFREKSLFSRLLP